MVTSEELGHVHLLYYYCGNEGPNLYTGLRSYLIMWIRPRRNRRVDRPWNGGSHIEKGGKVQSEKVIHSDKMNVG